MKEEIKLNNREGADLRLKQITPDSDLYRFVVDDAHSYCLDFININCDYVPSTRTITHYRSIDPVGGPLLVAFNDLDDYVIDEIVNCNTVRLREKNRNN